MLILRNSGTLEAVRSTDDGCPLNMPAREIQLLDLMDLSEGVKSERKSLLGEDYRCSEEEACTVHEN